MADRPIMPLPWCPLCYKDTGKKVKVKAYQLNLEEAVFMCATEECTWPVGYYNLLFMPRPMGKYWTEKWPAEADKFLVEHLKKQRQEALAKKQQEESELSSYTPPQTPGNCKDAIHHDSNGTGPPSVATVVQENHDAELQSSEQPIKPLEIPVIDCTVQTSSLQHAAEPLVTDCSSTCDSNTFDIPIIDFTNFNVSTGQIEACKLSHVDCTAEDELSFEKTTVKLGSVPAKSPVKVLVIKKETSVAKTVGKTNTLNNSISLLDIKDEKPNVPEKSVASASVQSKKFRLIGRTKTKSFDYKKEFDIFDDIKKAKSTNEKCKAKVAIKSKIDLDKLKPNEIRKVLCPNSISKASTLDSICKVESSVNKVIKLIKEEKVANVDGKIEKENCSLVKGEEGNDDCKITSQLPNKESNNDCNDHFDLDKILEASPSGFDSGKNWPAEEHNLESLLAMLEDDKSEDILIMTTKDEVSTSNSTVSSEVLKDKECDNNEIKMEVDSITEDDTLQCTIDEIDDPFFASLFSPPMNQ